MNDTNGIGTTHDNDDDWVIVHAGERGFIGKIIAEDAQSVTLHPVHHYMGNPNLQPTPKGLQLQLEQPMVRIVLPYEMQAHAKPLPIRWTEKVPITDLAPEVRAHILAQLAQCERVCRSLAAKGAGISLETTIPPNLPPPWSRQ